VHDVGIFTVGGMRKIRGGKLQHPSCSFSLYYLIRYKRISVVMYGIRVSVFLKILTTNRQASH